jgi:hypothetical protein
MEWKDSDLDFTKNCIFIDEAGFHINMRNNWARSKSGSSAIVKQPKNRAQSHTIIGAIHSSSIVHVVIRKSPPRKETQAAKKKREKLIMERREPQPRLVQRIQKLTTILPIISQHQKVRPLLILPSL